VADASSQPATLSRGVVFLGPPGAGKGTQAARLARHLDLPRVSTGDMLRDAIAKGTPVGQEAAPHIAKGRLVPDHLLVELVGRRIREQDCAEGCIFDGFPRTLAQAEALDAMLAGGTSHFTVFKFEVPREELLRRLSGRRWCPTCQATYHVYSKPPKVEGKCDKDGGDLNQRDDDKEQAVARRLAEYEETTAPIVGFYGSHAHFHRIDGDRAPDVVFAELQRLLARDR
jgi:adenylate kinase